jgi:mannose-1-phosphate guanylyltransferase/mannose-1-phosphate guanylyltransferase/mannose-6-phosphate isomerase
MNIIPVILSGGGGTRLWPMSTSERPKQFLALTGAQTMFQMTLGRVMDGSRFDAPIVVANASHSALVENQMTAAAVNDRTIIYEPSARNTAPAIALAALAASDRGAPMLVMPSDHIIADVPAFHSAIAAALPLVEQGWMVTFGIEPTGPETGYGYIRIGENLTDAVARVDSFVEKPDAATAQAMLDAGNHAWNGGIFLFRADIYLENLAKLAPEMLHAATMAIDKAERRGNAIYPDADAFAASPSNSIDYAVMEKAERVAVAPVAMGWSDVGSWDALYEIGEKAENGNHITGPARLIESSGNLIHSDGIRISAAGIDDLIIVATGNEVMVVPRGGSQIVKKLSES